MEYKDCFVLILFFNPDFSELVILLQRWNRRCCSKKGNKFVASGDLKHISFSDSIYLLVIYPIKKVTRPSWNQIQMDMHIRLERSLELSNVAYWDSSVFSNSLASWTARYGTDWIDVETTSLSWIFLTLICPRLLSYTYSKRNCNWVIVF